MFGRLLGGQVVGAQVLGVVEVREKSVRNAETTQETVNFRPTFVYYTQDLIPAASYRAVLREVMTECHYSEEGLRLEREYLTRT